MKVSELKDLLGKYPDDMTIVIDGYEGGYNDLTLTKQISILLNVYAEDYMGQHDDAPINAPNAVQALLLTGRNLIVEVDDA